MPIDDERREAARKLREAASYYESMERDVDFYPIESALGLKPTGETAYTPQSVRSLADLIGMGIPVDPGEAGLASVDGFIRERTGKPVYHDALLALAEEMVEMFRLGAFTGEGLGAKWCRELYDKYTRRIRETLGRVENNVQRSAEGWDDC